MEDMAESHRIGLTQGVAARFDHKLYETGIAMSQKERQAEQKLQSLSITTERTIRKPRSYNYAGGTSTGCCCPLF